MLISRLEKLILCQQKMKGVWVKTLLGKALSTLLLELETCAHV